MCSLHFAWVVDDTKCIVVTRVCVSVRVHMPTLFHGPGCNLGGMVGDAPNSCALLGGFAIGARVALLWQHNANPSYKLASTPRHDDIVRTRNVSECSVLSMPCSDLQRRRQWRHVRTARQWMTSRCIAAPSRLATTGIARRTCIYASSCHSSLWISSSTAQWSW